MDNHHGGLRSVMWPPGTAGGGGGSAQSGAARWCNRTGATVAPGEARKVTPGRPSEGRETHAARLRVGMTDIDDSHERLQRDAQFLCSDRRMDTELVDRLVLQLNRIYPQILSDKEAHRFRDLSVPTEARLAQLLAFLRGKGEEACHEFYRGLHILAENVYAGLPSRAIRREVADPKRTTAGTIRPQRYVQNDRGSMFFLSCFSVVVGAAMLYYYGEGETLRSTCPFLQGSAAGFSKGANYVFVSYAEVGRQRT
ncbi:caspase recruitment domain-containing protein 19 isoform X1 [Gasterosteus aculeatus]